MISEDGEVKIMDFGIARTLGGKKLTAHGALLGTIEYMSPEYLAEDTVHALGDVYSLGVIGYELITGVLPHRGGSVLEVIQGKLKHAPTPPHEIRHGCPLVVSGMILKAMHREPAKRYQSARHFLRDLLTLGYEKQFRVPTADLEPQQVEELKADSAASLVALPPLPAPKGDEVWEMIREASETPLEPESIPVLRHSVAVRKGRSSKTPYRGVMVAVLIVSALGTAFLVRRSYLSERQIDFARPMLPLVEAAKNCDFEHIQELAGLPTGAELFDIQGGAALSWAVRGNCLPVVNYLIEEGVDLNTTSDNGYTPLLWARKLQLHDIEKLLLHYGANTNDSQVESEEGLRSK
jgi:hypothetical protein